MSRWVRVDVDLFAHEFFASSEPFSDREAWLWLIANAAWKDTVHRVGNDLVDVPAGSLFATLRGLQSAWRWKSDKRVRSFLSRLENGRMVETKTDAGKTHITICNYLHYQDAGRKEDAARTQPGRSADALKTPVHQDTNTSSLRSDVPARAPPKPTPKSELLSVLDDAHATAVVEHRQRIRKPLTANAAKLLAGKFRRCADPNAAADAMIVNGWQGFEPQWLESRTAPIPRSQAPPHRERTISDALRERIGRSEHEHAPTIDGDYEAGPVPAAALQLFAVPSRR